MDIISMTRELGKAIQQDERYIAYMTAKAANDNDAELQRLIEDFGKVRADINTEMSKSEKNTEALKELDEKMKSLYSQIMGRDSMIAFNNAQNELEQLISDINQIVTMCANGENPDTCEIQRGCTGSCSTCGGCH
jgi:cell fate (sporulation/competence/biofilm development) regulator YlbF (YheA/YmcA/DUF963 family)